MPAKGLCFTYRYNNCISRRLQNEIRITPYINADGSEYEGIGNQYIGLWDTGATASMITNKVAQELGLIPTGRTMVGNAHGQQEANVYMVNILLPNRVRVQAVTVTEGMPAGCDALIGMDVINQGDFAVSNHQGHTTFSFRVPSMSEIDFVENSYMVPTKSNKTVGRNDLCTCGSGKKFKHCCGK